MTPGTGSRGKEQLSVRERIAQAVTRPEERSYLQTLPQFSDMSLEEVVKNTQHTLAHYAGDWAFLQYVFDQTGTDNPWRASAEAELLDPTLRRSEKDIRERGRVIAPTYRQQDLVRQLFPFVNPCSGSFFNAGLTSAYKFRTAFGTPHQRTIMEKFSQGPQRVLEQLDEDALSYFGSVQALMDELKTDDDLLKKVRSIKTKGAVTAVKEVESMLEHLARQELDVRVEYLQGVLARSGLLDRSFLVERQSRSPLFVYMDEHLEEQTGVVQSAYRILRSIDGEYDDEVKSIAFGVVLTAYAQNQYVNAQVVLRTELEDIEHINSLPDDDPLIEELGRLDTKGLEDVLGKHDVKVLDAARALQRSDFTQYRIRAWQQGTPEDYLADLCSLSDVFREAFEDEQGNLLGNTVRKELMREHEFRHVLVLGDWRAALDYHLQLVLHGSQEQFVRRTSITGMRELADRAVASVRKVRYLKNKLQHQGTDGVDDLPEGGRSELSSLRKGGFMPAERFVGDFSEVVERLGYLHERVNEQELWRNQGERLRTLARTGVFDPKMNLEGVTQKVMKYTSLDEVAEYGRAQRVMEHPALQCNVSFLPFVSEREIGLIKRIASTNITASTTPTDWEDYRGVRQAVVVSGNITNKLTLRPVMNPWSESLTYTSWGGLVLDGEAFRRTTAGYVRADEEFMMKARYMSSRSNNAMLREIGLREADFETWRFVHHDLTTDALVPASLQDHVNKAYEQVQRMNPVRVQFRFENPDRQFNDYNRRARLFRFHPETASWYAEVPQRRVDEAMRDVRAHSEQPPIFENP